MGDPSTAPALAFRPRLIPTLIALPAILVLLALGTWQMERRAWKADLIATMQSRLAMPPASLVELLPLGPEAAYRPVFVTGVFRHDREMHLVARRYKERIGAQVVTPLLLTEGRGMADSVLVNRGWVPEDRRAPARRPDSQPHGEISVTGILRWPSQPGLFTPDNDPARGLWYWVDIPAMARAADLARPAPVVIESLRNPADPEALPVGGQTIVRLPNNHLQYAVTWYALAAALLGTYILSQRRPRDSDRPS